MDRSFEDAVTWVTNSDYTKAGGTQTDWNNHTNMTKYGPITVNKYLSDQTSDWGVTVSLPSKEQVLSANNGSTKNLPGWLIQNLNSDNWSLTQYWTSTPNDNLYQVYYVAKNGLKDNFGAWGQLGVRPVITISKSRLD